MGMQLVAGRWFDAAPADGRHDPALSARAGGRSGRWRRAAPTSSINELAARRLGFRNPADAVGRTFRAALVDNEIGLVPVTIVGVVSDARFRSVRLPLDPIMFPNAQQRPHPSGRPLSTAIPAEVRAGVERVWKSVTTDVPFDAEFSDDIVAELYEAEDARAKTFAGFALLAVVVACLGLFGLAAFTAERRTKEIGIRKVLGARTRDIVRLLAWQFSKPVIIANLIAWPVAWWVMRDWLNTLRRAHRSRRRRRSCSPALLALAIAIGTIAGHAIKVARANPIHALRYEYGPAKGQPMWRNYLTVGLRALTQEPDLRVHQHLRPRARLRRLPDAPALRPLRDQLRRLAARRRARLPGPERSTRDRRPASAARSRCRLSDRRGALRQRFPADRERSTALDRQPGRSSRTARRLDAEHLLADDQFLRHPRSCRSSAAIRAPRSPHADSVVLTETEAHRRFGPTDVDRPDPHRHPPRRARSTSASPACSRICRATAISTCDGQRRRSGDFIADDARGADGWGCING